MSKKILMYSGCGAIAIMRGAYRKVFEKLGMQVYTHNPENKTIAVFDIFKKLEPTTFFGGVYEIDRATLKCLKSRRDLEIILWCPNYGPLNKDISPEDGVLTASENDLKVIRELLDNGNKLKYVFTYYHQNCLEQTHSFYQRDFGLTPIGIPLAADLFDYPLGEYREELACDWAFVGGAWSLKNQSFNEWMWRICADPSLKGKIFGWGHHVFPQHVGPIDTTLMPHLFHSARVCPNIFEPHSLKFGVDVNERSYKILSAGGFCVSQRVESAARDIFTEGEIVFADSPEDFTEKIKHFAKYPDERLPYIQRGTRYAYEKGSYFHRVADLAQLMNWTAESFMLKVILGQIKKRGEINA